jgi:hypothetical protein
VFTTSYRYHRKRRPNTEGVRFLPDALVQTGHGDLALKLVGRDTTACDAAGVVDGAVGVSCTFSQQLARGPGTLWESWNYDSVWTGGSVNHIMFAGGPGIFIHQAAGLPEAAWMSETAEVEFKLDAAVASRIGGADVWSDSPHGDAKLSWRVGALVDRNEVHHLGCNQKYSRVMEVEVLGPVPRPGRKSWLLRLPIRVLLRGAYQHTSFDATDLKVAAVRIGGGGGGGRAQFRTSCMAGGRGTDDPRSGCYHLATDTGCAPQQASGLHQQLSCMHS